MVIYSNIPLIAPLTVRRPRRGVPQAPKKTKKIAFKKTTVLVVSLPIGYVAIIYKKRDYLLDSLFLDT